VCPCARSQFSESLDGMSTIRAFGVQERENVRFLELKDNNNRVYFARWVQVAWCTGVCDVM
jgi:hypothetical protein